MKNTIFLISIDCSIKESPQAVEKVIDITKNTSLKYYLNIPLEVLNEKGFNFGLQKGINEIALESLISMVENNSVKILPSAYDLSYYQCFPVSSFESKFAKIKTTVDKSKLLSKIVDYSFQAPFQADFLRKEFETEYFKLFSDFVLGIVKKSKGLHLAIKSKLKTRLFSYISLFDIALNSENENNEFLEKKINRALPDSSFCHFMIKSLEDIDILKRSIQALESLLKKNKVEFFLNYEDLKVKFIQILQKELIYPLNNLKYQLSPNYYKEYSYVFNIDDDRYKRSFTLRHNQGFKNIPADDIAGDNDSMFFNTSGKMKLEDELVFLGFSKGSLDEMKFKNEHVFQKISCFSNLLYQKTLLKFEPELSLVVEKFNSRSFKAFYKIKGDCIKEPGTVMVDYSFIDGFLYPIIKIETIYPVFYDDALITEFTPYVLSISFSKLFLKDFTIKNLYPDNSLGNLDVKNIKTVFMQKNKDLYEGLILGNAYLIKNREKSFLISNLVENKNIISPLYYSVTKGRHFVNLNLYLGKTFKNIKGYEFNKLQKETNYFCIYPEQNNFLVLENIKDNIKKELKNI